jgi:predicted lipoprotein with Yx(FWY)xxD motif
MRRLLLLMLAIAALAAAGCGSDSDDGDDDGGSQAAAQTETTPRAPERKPAEPKPGTTIRLGDSQFGKILFDRAGQAIYLFDKERSDRAECYGECAAAWPPVFTEGEPRAGAGIDQKLLGTTKRRDGKTQVTYNGHPLYFYAHEGRNEVKCHNVREFGGLWLVLNGAGEVPS